MLMSGLPKLSWLAASVRSFNKKDLRSKKRQNGSEWINQKCLLLLGATWPGFPWIAYFALQWRLAMTLI